ncbi:hypothetical protein QUF80_01695 [Desulfococcaceae bacterium HSG8]|nr:hypothetical protein [Desulfococcaceae bacterium HSG8]
MKIIRNIIIFMFVAGFLTAIGIAPVTAQDIGEVQNLISDPDPSDTPVSRIIMTWEPPLESSDISGYYTLFNEESEHTFTLENTHDITVITDTEVSSDDYAASEPDASVPAHFHVAAADTYGNIGPTSDTGPFYIDAVPPSDAKAAASETVSEPVVTLTLEAEGAAEVFISNTEYEGGDGQWKPLAASEEWLLAAGGGEKTVYVRFRDGAGNTADAPPVTILYVAGDTDCNGIIGLKDAVVSMQVLTGINSPDICNSDVDGDGKTGMLEAVFVLKKISE